MHFIPAFILASSAALIAAAPAPAPVTIGADDVILYGKGRYTIMKRSDLEELETIRNSGVVPPKPTYLEDSLYTVTGNETKDSADKLSKRAGDTLIIPNPKSRFLGWDVLMSAVAQGGPEKTRVTVTSGYSISNSIAVGLAVDYTFVKDLLKATTTIDYTTTWESNQSQQFSAEVPAGKYGAFVSNAWTDRESGSIWKGKIGEIGDLTHYQADSFTPRTYGDLNWVDGVISLCVRDTFPMPRCIGEGTL